MRQIAVCSSRPRLTASYRGWCTLKLQFAPKNISRKCSNRRANARFTLCTPTPRTNRTARKLRGSVDGDPITESNLALGVVRLHDPLRSPLTTRSSSGSPTSTRRNAGSHTARPSRPSGPIRGGWGPFLYRPALRVTNYRPRRLSRERLGCFCIRWIKAPPGLAERPHRPVAPI